MKEKIALEDRRSFSPVLSRFELPFVSVLFRKSHLLKFIRLAFDKGDVDGGAYQIVRFSALLSAAGSSAANHIIYCSEILCVIYENP